MKTVLISINSKYVHTGLGIRYVAQYARDCGEEIELVEETINTRMQSVLDNLINSAADVYGFSVHIWNRRYVFELAVMLKLLRPEAVIVLGGPEVSFAVAKAFAELPVVDYIVQGEGERSFAALLKYLRKGGAVPENIAYRSADGVMLNGGTTVVEDLAILPFPYDDIEQIRDSRKIVYYECTRGCPYRCAYCLSGISKNVRKRPLEYVLRDLDRFLEAKVELVKFVDRTYNLDESYFLPIMKYLAAADTKTVFHFEIKADTLSENALDFLAKVPAGRFQFEIGIQSTNAVTLRAINRWDDWQLLSGNIKRLLETKNIHIHVDLIAGLPFEGLSEFAESFNAVHDLNADKLQLGFLKVLPGTELAAQQHKHRLVFMPQPPYEILATKYLRYHDLRMLKMLEEVFDHTGNNSCFKNTMRALISCSESNAFEFYCELTGWWHEHDGFMRQHNNKSVAKLLHGFILEKYDCRKAEVLLEILRFDVFVHIKDWRPEWLNWRRQEIFEKMSRFWRDETKVKKYVPDYEYGSWSTINKKYPVECFKYHWLTKDYGDIYVLKDTVSGKVHLLDI